MIGSIFDQEDEFGGNSYINAGSAFIFDRDSGGNWTQTMKVVSPISDRSSGDGFGCSVAIDSNNYVFGAQGEAYDEYGLNLLGLSGAVYFFEDVCVESTSTIGISSCNSYDSPSGSNTWVSSGIYSDTLIGASSNGCDSIIEITLTITQPTNNTITVSNCTSYASPSGNYVWNMSGLYQDTLFGANSNGCDSVLTIDLTITTPDLNVNEISNVLTSSATGSLTFQWLDCDANYSAILNETNQVYAPSSNGNYAVQITENGCVDTSACYSILTIGLDENDLGSDWKIVPNPTTGKFQIINTELTDFQIHIIDFTGRTVFNVVTNDPIISVD